MKTCSFYPFSYVHFIAKGDVDELGHANYNKLKRLFEEMRMYSCTRLGFGRRRLRLKHGIGLFMLEDRYQYLRELFVGDQLNFAVTFSVESRTRLAISLYVFRTTTDRSGISTMERVALVDYRMAMMSLKTRRPVEISREIHENLALFANINAADYARQEIPLNCQ